MTTRKKPICSHCEYLTWGRNIYTDYRMCSLTGQKKPNIRKMCDCITKLKKTKQ